MLKSSKTFVNSGWSKVEPAPVRWTPLRLGTAAALAAGEAAPDAAGLAAAEAAPLAAGLGAADAGADAAAGLDAAAAVEAAAAGLDAAAGEDAGAAADDAGALDPPPQAERRAPKTSPGIMLCCNFILWQP